MNDEDSSRHKKIFLSTKVELVGSGGQQYKGRILGPKELWQGKKVRPLF